MKYCYTLGIMVTPYNPMSIMQPVGVEEFCSGDPEPNSISSCSTISALTSLEIGLSLVLRTVLMLAMTGLLWWRVSLFTMVIKWLISISMYRPWWTVVLTNSNH